MASERQPLLINLPKEGSEQSDGERSLRQSAVIIPRIDKDVLTGKADEDDTLLKLRSRNRKLDLISSPLPQKSKGLPCRYKLYALVFFGFFNVYSMRVNLSVAIVKMADHFGWSTSDKSESSWFGSCVCVVENNSTKEPITLCVRLNKLDPSTCSSRACSCTSRVLLLRLHRDSTARWMVRCTIRSAPRLWIRHLTDVHSHHPLPARRRPLLAPHGLPRCRRPWRGLGLEWTWETMIGRALECQLRVVGAPSLDYIHSFLTRTCVFFLRAYRFPPCLPSGHIGHHAPSVAGSVHPVTRVLISERSSSSPYLVLSPRAIF